MKISVGLSLLIIVVVAFTTFFTRALPFLLFGRNEKVPKLVTYLGAVLPPAVIGMLVIYCLKNITIFTGNHGIPEIAAILVVVILHLWKRNNLLSIGMGTVFYMILVQTVY